MKVNFLPNTITYPNCLVRLSNRSTMLWKEVTFMECCNVSKHFWCWLFSTLSKAYLFSWKEWHLQVKLPYYNRKERCNLQAKSCEHFWISQARFCTGRLWTWVFPSVSPAASLWSCLCSRLAVLGCLKIGRDHSEIWANKCQHCLNGYIRRNLLFCDRFMVVAVSKLKLNTTVHFNVC